MPHPPALISNILGHVMQSYTGKDVAVEIEKKLPLSNRLVYPDIQVFLSGVLVCVVEIGYTRPEKIKLYRDMGIKDIRWYSKDGELINHNIENKVEVVKFVPDKSTTFKCLKITDSDGLMCAIDKDQHNRECFVERTHELIATCLHLHGTRAIKKVYGDTWASELPEDCYGHIIASDNGQDAFIVWSCDYCGKSFVEYEFPYEYIDLLDYKDFLIRFYKNGGESLDFPGVVGFCKEIYSIDVDFSKIKPFF